eukprot:364686-Chlamydomonas_euryale.AAC.11
MPAPTASNSLPLRNIVQARGVRGSKSWFRAANIAPPHPKAPEQRQASPLASSTPCNPPPPSPICVDRSLERHEGYVSQPQRPCLVCSRNAHVLCAAATPMCCVQPQRPCVVCSRNQHASPAF